MDSWSWKGPGHHSSSCWFITEEAEPKRAQNLPKRPMPASPEQVRPIAVLSPAAWTPSCLSVGPAHSISSMKPSLTSRPHARDSQGGPLPRSLSPPLQMQFLERSWFSRIWGSTAPKSCNILNMVPVLMVHILFAWPWHLNQWFSTHLLLQSAYGT